MTFNRLAIPQWLVEEVKAHARKEQPNECCGLLAGHIESGTGVVAKRYAIHNSLASPTAYETDARDMLRAFRDMRATELELLGVYHSHPTSRPVPSQRDIEQNTYGETVIHLIVGFADATPTVQAWWLGEASYREAEYAITPPTA